MFHDLVLAGDPLHSLLGTRDNAEVLQRKTGLAAVPGTVPRRLGEILREPGLLGATAGGILVLALMRKRAALPIAAGFVSIAAFCVLAGAGLPILGRYLLLPAALLAVFCGAGAFGWLQLERDDPWRTRWMAIGAVVLVAFAVFAPGQVKRVDDLRASMGTQERDPLRPARDHERHRLPAGRRAEPPAGPARRALDGLPPSGSSPPSSSGPPRATTSTRPTIASSATSRSTPRPEDPDGDCAVRVQKSGFEPLLGPVRELLKKVDRAPDVEVGLRGLNTSLTPAGRPRVARR